MPAKVKVRILAGRNLPVMDKSSDASDAFVEVKLGNTTYKTEVYRRSLNPFWNSEWFRFEVTDQELQDEPLQIRVMDYDTYSANDAIGKVYINLNPLLVNPGRSMSGWLPIYDTLHGIRGEINCMVKVNLFADNNRYRHSSCGVRFFFSDIPNGYKCDAILGFVDELLVNDDPEYQWIDKIRTPRASNEARQTLFTKLSGEVQRKLGLKAEIFGGNAVIGYQLSFDLEGGSGIVGRGIGTAVVLSKIGFPFDGIISTLCMNNNNHHLNPYSFHPSDNRTTVDQYSPYYDTRQQNRQSLSLHRKEQTERSLVHSSSADCFFKVKSRKKMYTLTKLPFIANKVDSENENDDSEYLDCKEGLADDLSDVTDFDSTDLNGTSTSNNSVSYCSTKKKHFLHSYRPLSANNSFEFRNLRSEKHSGISHPSSGLLLRKLLQTNKHVTQKLSIVTRPLTKSSGLIEMLFFRRQQQFNVQQQEQKLQPTDVINQAQVHGAELNDTASSLKQNIEACDNNQQAHLTPQRSISPLQSSKAINAQSLGSTSLESPLASSSGTTSKRRRDKSLSTSIDDSLSIIEEKHDDIDEDQNNQQLVSKQQQSLLARQSQINKFRLMTRTKEIDLNDDYESNEFSRPKGSSFSSSIYDEDSCEVDTNILSSEASPPSITNPLTDTKPDYASENVLSSSSPSTSILTEETIKARISSPTIMKEQQSKDLQMRARSLSSGSKSTRKTNTGRSNTDISQQFSNDSQLNADIINSTDTLVDPRGIALSNLDIPTCSINNRDIHSVNNVFKQVSPVENIRQSTQSKSPPYQAAANTPATGGGGANSFVQSVRAVKAHQHLLQNMVKQQNQNLLTSSSGRAKNAFTCPNRVYQSEYPFVTLKRYPENMIQSTGGVVSVHSVKLLDHIINDEESETRDIWWTEIRKEIRSHAKALNCNIILGYTETSKVLGDVCVLSAFGTAAILKPIEPTATSHDMIGRSINEQVAAGKQQYSRAHPAQLLKNLKVTYQSNSLSPLSPANQPSSSLTSDWKQQQQQQPTSLENKPFEVSTGTSMNRNYSLSQSCGKSSTSGGIEVASEALLHPPHPSCASGWTAGIGSEAAEEEIDCSFCHTSLVCVESISSLPSCTICKSSKVPDILLLTIEPPQNLNIVSAGTLVQARVCRTKRDSHGEVSAKEIGDALPFLEYELHRQLFGKLKFKGMNCLFNFCVDISIGENMLTGIATGTGCFVLGLPRPEPPQISAGKGIRTSKLNEIKSLIAQSAEKNRKHLGLDYIDSQLALYHDQCQQLRQLQQMETLDRPTTTGPHFTFSKAGLTQSGDSINGQQQQQQQEPLSEAQAISCSQQADNEPATSEARREANSGSPSSLTNPAAASLNHQQENVTSSERDAASFSARTTRMVTSKHSKSRHRRHHHHHHHHHQHHLRKQNAAGKGGAISSSPDKNIPAENLINLLSSDSNIVLEVDDNEDADIIALLVDTDIPEGYLVCNSESIPSVHQSSITSINMFTHVMRAKLSSLDQFAQQFDWILQSLFVKLRRSLPCCLTNICFLVDLPETHVIQISVTGCLLGLLSSAESARLAAIQQLRPHHKQQRSNSASAVAACSATQSSLSAASTTTSSSSSSSFSLSEPSSSSEETPVNCERVDKSSSSSHTKALEPLKSGASQDAQRDSSPFLKATSSAQSSKVKQETGSSSSNSNSLSKQLSKANLASLFLRQSSSTSADKRNNNEKRPASLLDETTTSSTSNSVGNLLAGAIELVGLAKSAPSERSQQVNASASTQTNSASCGADSSSSSSSSADRGINSSIDISSLSYIPGAKEYHYLGNLAFSFVRETNSVRENGGLNGFIHCFLMEVYAIVRAHVSALGGNAFLSFRLQQSCIFYHSNKNQAQCLISVAGDAVQVTL